MKKILFALVLTMFFMTGVQAEEVGDLTYKQDKLVVVDGNVTLNFNWSTNNNADDVQIVKFFYSIPYNLTVYRIESKTIVYDYTFVNDTKYYHYNMTGSKTDYVISVNYSSIHVPFSPYQHILNLLEEANESLNVTSHQLEDMTQNYTDSMDTIGMLSSTTESLQNQIATLLAFQTEARYIIEDYRFLENTSNNQTIEIATLKGVILDHQEWAESKNRTIEELENPFCLFYTKSNPNGIGRLNLFHISASWVIIGFIVCLVLLILYMRKDEFNKKSKTLTGEKESTKNKVLSIFKSEKKEKEKEVDWNEDIPDVEKKILKPPKKADEDIAQEVDKIIKQRATEQIDNMFR